MAVLFFSLTLHQPSGLLFLLNQPRSLPLQSLWSLWLSCLEYFSLCGSFSSFRFQLREASPDDLSRVAPFPSLLISFSS